MFGLFKKRAAGQARVEPPIDISDYFNKQVRLLGHVYENSDKIENRFITTLLRHLSDIQGENVQMQMLTIDFMLAQIRDLDKDYVVIKHDLDVLTGLSEAVKGSQMDVAGQHVELIAYQHAISHHCAQVLALLEQISTMFREDLATLERWGKKNRISKSEQSDLKNDLFVVNCSFKKVISNVQRMKAHLHAISMIKEHAHQKKPHYVRRYFLHALHGHSIDAIDRLAAIRGSRQKTAELIRFIERAEKNLALTTSLLQQDTEHLEEFSAFSYMLSAMAEYIQKLKTASQDKHARHATIKDILDKIKETHVTLRQKVKLINEADLL